MTPNAARVSIVVPVGGDSPRVNAAFERCLQSLANLDPAAGEIVVVLDGENQERAGLVEASGLEAVLTTLPQPGGPAVARNQGAARASGELLFFVDADVEVAPDAIARLLAVFEERPALAALIGSYDAEPADPSWLSQYRNLLHHFVHQNARLEASTFWGACGAIRKQVFDQVAGFDESFEQPSIEDIELGARLRQLGQDITLLKELQVKHLKRWTVLNMLETDLFKRAVPWTELMLGSGGLIQDLNVKNSDRVSVVAAFLLLGSLATLWLWPPLALSGLAAALTQLVLNRGFYRFLSERRGTAFAVFGIFWHWVYFLVCGVGFVLGALRHLLRVGLARGPKPNA